VIDDGVALVRERVVTFSCARGVGLFSFTQASELDRAVLATLEEYAGTVENRLTSPIESLMIQRIMIEGGRAHLYGFDDTTQTHQFVSEFTIHYLDPQRL